MSNNKHKLSRTISPQWDIVTMKCPQSPLLPCRNRVHQPQYHHSLFPSSVFLFSSIFILLFTIDQVTPSLKNNVSPLFCVSLLSTTAILVTGQQYSQSSFSSSPSNVFSPSLFSSDRSRRFLFPPSLPPAFVNSDATSPEYKASISTFASYSPDSSILSNFEMNDVSFSDTGLPVCQVCWCTKEDELDCRYRNQLSIIKRIPRLSTKNERLKILEMYVIRGFVLELVLNILNILQNCFKSRILNTS